MRVLPGPLDANQAYTDVVTFTFSPFHCIENNGVSIVLHLTAFTPSIPELLPYRCRFPSDTVFQLGLHRHWLDSVIKMGTWLVPNLLSCIFKCDRVGELDSCRAALLREVVADIPDVGPLPSLPGFGVQATQLTNAFSPICSFYKGETKAQNRNKTDPRAPAGLGQDWHRKPDLLASARHTLHVSSPEAGVAVSPALNPRSASLSLRAPVILSSAGVNPSPLLGFEFTEGMMSYPKGTREFGPLSQNP